MGTVVKLIVTGIDPTLPLGEREAYRIAKGLEAFIADPSSQTACIQTPVNIYQLDGEIMRKVGGEGAQPFRVDEKTILVPISESVENYNYVGYEVLRLVEGKWTVMERTCTESPQDKAIKFREWL